MLAPYDVTEADRAPLPASWSTSTHVLGLSGVEHSRPFASFFRDTPSPAQPAVLAALEHGPTDPDLTYGLGEVADRLARPGLDAWENGWARRPDGVTVVACRTDMPGVTAEMWDWWFGWHSTDAARYKLWHPTAHLFAALGEDRSRDRSLTDRQRYVDNVSYVDELVGAARMRLAIRFLDPTRLGFVLAPGTTYICARTSYSHLPLAQGWLVHQVRPTGTGTEMRSRFFLNESVQVLDLPRHSAPGRGARALSARPVRSLVGRLAPRVGPLVMPRRLGPDLLEHCAVEMNHLAGFLPALYEQFRGTP